MPWFLFYLWVAVHQPLQGSPPTAPVPIVTKGIPLPAPPDGALMPFVPPIVITRPIMPTAQPCKAYFMAGKTRGIIPCE